MAADLLPTDNGAVACSVADPLACLGWTASYVARETGVDAATISKIRNGAADRVIAFLRAALKAQVLRDIERGRLDPTHAEVLANLMVEAGTYDDYPDAARGVLEEAERVAA